MQTNTGKIKALLNLENLLLLKQFLLFLRGANDSFPFS